ncbi:MAG: tetratricopeptide repeat protein [Pseudomonadota bacterium]
MILFIVCSWTVMARSQSANYHSAQDALATGDIDEAILELKLALQDNPRDPKAHYMLGSLLAWQGMEDQAIIGFQRAITLDPTYPEALHNLGTLLLRRDQAVPAAELLEAAIDYNPDYLPSYNNLAKAYFLAGLPEFAIGTYEEVLHRDEVNTIASRNLALLVAAAGKKTKGKKSEPDWLVKFKDPGAGQTESPTIDKKDKKDSAPKKRRAVVKPAPYSEAKAKELRELLRDLPHIKVEARAGMLTLTGWTRGPQEQEILERILAGWPNVLDLTATDTGDPQRMLEVDAVIFIIIGVESQTVGFNFLQLIELSYTAFASNPVEKWTGLAAPGTIQNNIELPKSGSLAIASVDYDVNIANAVDERVAVLARPHLTTLSGTPAEFLAGGEWVFKVSGLESGDIKPYPFGTSLMVTPTLLRTPGDDGEPRIHLKIQAKRTSVLEFLTATQEDDSVVFDKLNVSSQAVLGLGETLILSGLSQRESRTSHSGVPILREIPLIKYLFSSTTTVETNTSVIILLTPRDPAFMGERNRRSLASFIQLRRDYLKAQQGTEEDMRQFEERNPNWRSLPPNRFASHFFLTRTSELYRRVSGEDIIEEDLDLDLLGNIIKDKNINKRKKQKNGDGYDFHDDYTF